MDNSFSLAESVTAKIHSSMANTALVLDAFVIGQWVDNRPPTSVFVTFGSAAQKTTFFKKIAKTILEKREGADKLKGISCRDAFPREHIMEAKRMAQKGFSLRQKGQVAAFRVVARGPACIPVLEVRVRHTNNMRGRWEIFTGEGQQPAKAVAAAEAAAPTAVTTTPRRGA